MKNIVNKYNNLPLAVKATFWFVFCSFLQKGISIITTPIFTRILTTGEYGKFNLFNSWMEIIGVFITLRLTAGVYMQGLVKYESDFKRFCVSIKSLYTVLILISSLMYLLFSEYINAILGFTTMEMFAMILIIWSTGIFTFWSMEKRVYFQYKSIVALTIITTLLQPTLSIILISYSADKVFARIVAIVLVSMVFYGGLYIVDIIKTRRIFDTKYWKYAILFNIPLIPHYLSSTILNSSDRLMIGAIENESAVGIYSLAYSLSLIMIIFNTSILQVVEPWLYKCIKLKSFDNIGKILYILLTLVAFLNILLIALAPEAISVFAPYEYKEAVWIIPPVAMSVYFMFMYSFFATFEFYYEKKNYILISTVVAATINIILNFIFINYFGYVAAGYTTLLCYMIFAFLHYFYMKKIVKEHLDNVKIYSIKKILIITMCFILFGSAFMITYHVRTLRYLLLLLVFIILLMNKRYIQEVLIKVYKERGKKNG